MVTACRSATFSYAAVGSYHGCAIDSAGALVCWGSNEDGQSVPP